MAMINGEYDPNVMREMINENRRQLGMEAMPAGRYVSKELPAEPQLPSLPAEPFRHHNGEIDFPNGDRVRWANGWWMADRKNGSSTKHATPKEAELALYPLPAEPQPVPEPLCAECGMSKREPWHHYRATGKNYHVFRPAQPLTEVRVEEWMRILAKELCTNFTGDNMPRETLELLIARHYANRKGPHE